MYPDKWIELSDGVRFAIDDGGCLWIDGSRGQRTGLYRYDGTKVGIYLNKDQVLAMLAELGKVVAHD